MTETHKPKCPFCGGELENGSYLFSAIANAVAHVDCAFEADLACRERYSETVEALE